MPFYSYRCTKCSRILDIQQRIKEEVKPFIMSTCCDVDAELVITSAPSINFKGGGWTPKGS